MELEDEELEVVVDVAALVDGVTTAGPVAIFVVVVVVVVVADPATHFPFTKISPSLLGQLLQATPPSL